MDTHSFNSNAGTIRPGDNLTNKSASSDALQQVSPPPSPPLESRLLNLESAHADLYDEFNTLEELGHDMRHSLCKVKPVSQNTSLVESHQTAIQFKEELEQLICEVHESVNGGADEMKAHSKNTPKANGSVPSHIRASSVTSHGPSQKSLPPHLRGKKATDTFSSSSASTLSLDTTRHEHEPLVTDGPVDTVIQPSIPAAAPSPPLSPPTTVQGDAPIIEVENMSLDGWKPYYLTTLASLPAKTRAKIPAKQTMITFTFDMLQNTFGGIAWSPGLRYINKSGTPLPQNRTYYMLDPTHEPYLPKMAGEHGAKLTAFFNKAPEEVFENLPAGTNSYTNVPMFVQVSKGRYAYFGNYSQTRWSDKLDNDTMKARVPESVKLHIAKDLAATPCEDWVTQELKKHFFPKPQYEGAVLVPTSDDTTFDTTAEEQHTKQLTDGIKDYIQELAEWEREASMKTAMIKPDFILDAFDAADADDPPALRLWWEYLECVDWKLDFYNMLVGFQARTDSPK